MKKGKDKRSKFTQQNPLFKRRKFCRFTAAGVEEVDYKDVDTLRDFITETGKIIPKEPAINRNKPSGIPKLLVSGKAKKTK